MDRIYFHPYQWTKKSLKCFNNQDVHGYWFFVEGFNDKNESILARIRYNPWFYVYATSNKEEDLQAILLYLKSKQVRIKESKIVKKTPPYYYGTPDVLLLKLTFFNKNDLYFSQKFLTKPIDFGDGRVEMELYENKEDCVIKYHKEQKLNHTGWLYVEDYKIMAEDDKLSDFQNEILIHDNTQVHMVEDDEMIRKLGIPVPSILSFDIECSAENEKSMPNAENPNDEVIMVSALFQDRKKQWSKYTICLNRSIKVDDVHLKEVKTESELCIEFTNLVRNLDPDIIIGHNVFKFDWKYLAYRYALKTDNQLLPYIGRYHHWRLINYGDKMVDNEGRLKEDKWESSAYSDVMMTYIPAPGRIQMDLLPIIMRSGFKLDSYKLEFISQAVLGEGKIGLEPVELFRLYKLAKECSRLQQLENNQCKDSKFESLRQIEGEDWKQQLEQIERKSTYEIDRYCVKDTELPVRIFEKINLWVNLIEDSKIVHVNIFDLYTRGQGIRVFNQEYMELMDQNYVVIKQNVQKRKYKGAFVFTALVGYYKKVSCLDFAKLYPSIMIAFNICYTTFVAEDPANLRQDIKDEDCNVFDWEEEEDDDEEVDEDDIFGEKKKKKKNQTRKVHYRFRFVKPHLRKGVLPTILERLADARDDAKAQLKKEKNEFMKVVLDKRQNNIKISMNSIYGNKGTNMAKMPLYEAAMCTTAKGRQLIHQTANFIESKYGVKVVYGDSVAPDTPILCRINNKVQIRSIQSLGSNWEEYRNFKHTEEGLYDKQQDQKVKFEVWTDKGWSQVRRVIRHKCNKKMFEVTTTNGCVRVTEDHSLILQNLEQIKPKDVQVGTKLLHSYPEANNKKQVSVCKTILGDDVYCAMKYYEYKMYGTNFRLQRIKNGYQFSTSYETDHSIVSIQEIPNNYNFVYDLETECGRFQAGVGELIVKNTDSVMFVNPVDEPTKFNLVYDADNQKIQYEQGLGKKVVIHKQKRYEIDNHPHLMNVLKSYEQKMDKINQLKNKIDYGKSMRFIAKEVSSLFPPPVMLEYEKTFRNYLLVGKKMYAGMLANDKNMDEYNEKKFFCRGLPIARRDNCKYLRITMKTIFLMIFQNKTEDEVFDYIMSRLELLLSGKVDIEDLYIYKKIGKEEAYKSETTDMLFFLRYLKSKGEDPQPGDRYEYLLSTANCKYKGEKYRTLRYLKDEGLDINYMLYFESYFAKPIQKVIHCWNPYRFPKNLFSKILTKFIQKTGTKDVKQRFLEFLKSGIDVDNLPEKGQKSIKDFFQMKKTKSLEQSFGTLEIK